MFSTQQAYNQGLLQQQRTNTDYERNMGDMTQSQGIQQRQLAEEAMRSGLANSGWLDTSAAEQSYDFARDFENLQTGYTRETADRNAAMSAAIQDYIRNEQAYAGDAVSRYTAEQQRRAAEDQGILTPFISRRINRILSGGRGRRKGHRGGRH